MNSENPCDAKPYTSVCEYIAAVKAFKEETERTRGADSLLFFRGHTNCKWPCKPTIARGRYGPEAIYYQPKEEGKASNEAEWILFSRFREGRIPRSGDTCECPG
jgi:hypothetical protein